MGIVVLYSTEHKHANKIRESFFPVPSEEVTSDDWIYTSDYPFVFKLSSKAFPNSSKSIPEAQDVQA